MAEAVIVSTARTPIGRARKGSLADVRPEDMAAFAVRSALEKVPELDPADVVDVMLGCGMPGGAAGDEPRPARGAARRAAGHGSGHDGQPLLRLQPADDPHGLPRDQGGRGRRVRRRRRRVDHAGVGYPKTVEELHPRLAGGPDAITNVYMPMGITAENVAERWDVDARGDGPLRAALAGACRRGAAGRVLRSGADAVPEGGRDGRGARRRPAGRVDAGEAGVARAGVRPGRQGHRRERVPA